MDDLQSKYELNSVWADRVARLILVGLAVDILAAFVLGKSVLEATLTVLASGLIAIGVWGELWFAKRAKEAGDGIVAQAHARAAEADARAAETNLQAKAAELRLAEFRTPRRELMTADVTARMADKLKQFAGTAYDIGLGEGDGEQADFVWDLESVLKAADWHEVHWGVHAVGISTIMRPGRPVLGSVAAQNVEIHLDPAAAELTPAADTLVLALNEAGIAAQQVTFNAHSTNTHAIHILVGPKR